jgi:hypothetical protein
MVVMVRLIAWMSEPHVRALAELLPEADLVVAASPSEVLDARPGEAVVFVDAKSLPRLAGQGKAIAVPTVGISEDLLPGVVGWLGEYAWLSHIVSATALLHPLAGEHLRNVLATLVEEKPVRLLDWVDRSVVGRRVLLGQASRRAERLEKMGEFFETNGASSRTIQVLRDAAEELLTNAFYDAPVAAGIVNEPISRTRDVILPDDHACDLAYGCRDDLAIVRVRDPFGSLSRARLVEVLTRCARMDMQVEVDETMGGAGLGLWRIFSGASLVGISVRAGRGTEILVGMWKRAGSGRPFCTHLFFEEGRKAGRAWMIDKDSTVATAVTLLSKSQPA